MASVRSGVKVLKSWKVFNGRLLQVTHDSLATKTPMRFSVFLPQSSEKVPILYFLSGLTCTDDNVMQKSGAQRYLAEHSIGFVAPDTSPRGAGVAGEDDSYDFGSGAGFYLNSTQDPYKTNYRMYDYIVQELPEVLDKAFPELDVDNAGISGHSMGGHGALTIALKNKEKYKSVSAFSPICNPVNSPWGQNAFSKYLGEDRSTWEDYDASMLMKKHGRVGQGEDFILIDQGNDDEFLHEQLLPEAFQAACAEVGQPLKIRMSGGYDHSYYFIQTFIGDHVDFHARALKKS